MVCAGWSNNIFAVSIIPISYFVNKKLSATGYASYSDSNKNGVYARYVNNNQICVWASTTDIGVYVYAR